jgi:hypothetical protein
MAESPLSTDSGTDSAEGEGQRPRLVFLQAPAQLQALRTAYPELLDGARLVGMSSRLLLAQVAEREGIPFCPYSDWLTASDFARAAEEAQELSHAWFTALAGPAAPRDLLEAVRLEIQQAFHEILLAHRVLTCALDDLQPGEVVLAPGTDEKVAALVDYEGGQRSIPVVRPRGRRQDARGKMQYEGGQRSLPQRSGRHRGLPLHAWRAGRLLRYLRQAAHNARVLAAYRFRQRSNPCPLMLSFGAGVDSVNQQRLMPAVEAQGRVSALLMRAGDTNSSMWNRPGKGEHPVLHFIPWNSMLRARRHAALCRQWWEAFQKGQATYHGPHPFLFANPQFSAFFARIFLHLLPHTLATRQDLRTWLDRLCPSLVLTSNEVSFPVRALVLEARQRGIPTLGLVHSGLNNMYYRDFLSDRMAVWGQVHVRDFVRVLGKQPAQLCPIGNPQYDTFGPDVSGAPAAGSTVHVARTPRVVVITAVAQWHMLYYNQREHLRTWRELERLPDLGVHVTIKPHPRFDDYDFYRSLQHPLADWRDDCAGISLARDAFLEEVMPTCDLVIVPNLPTTGAVEAMLWGKPVICLMCGFEEVECCTSIAPGCLVVHDVTQVCPTILSVLHSRDRQEELVRKGQAYLDELLGPRDKQATRRMAELVASMVAGDRS